MQPSLPQFPEDLRHLVDSLPKQQAKVPEVKTTMIPADHNALLEEGKPFVLLIQNGENRMRYLFGNCTDSEVLDMVSQVIHMFSLKYKPEGA